MPLGNSLTASAWTTPRAAFQRDLRHARQRNLPYALALIAVVAAALFFSAAPRESSFINIGGGVSLMSQLTVRAGSTNATALCGMDNPHNFLGSSNSAWLGLLLPLIVLTFAGLAVVTDEYFVPCLEVLCSRLKLSEDVAGATFMAAGSSAPELFTALVGTFRTKDDVGVGTIVGSAVFNILVIIGLSAALSTGSPVLDWRPLLRDSAFYSASVFLLLTFVLFVSKGQIDWWEGLILILSYVAYILFMKFGNEPYMKATEKYIAMRQIREQSLSISATDGVLSLNDQDQNAVDEITTSNSPSEAVVPVTQSHHLVIPLASDPNFPLSTVHYSPEGSSSAESTEKQVKKQQHPRMPSVLDEISLDVSPFETSVFGEDSEEPESIFRRPSSISECLSLPLLFPWRFLFWLTIPDVRRQNRKRLWPITFLIAIVWIMAITFAMVEMTTLAGCYIGIPSAVMGLTLLAAGTSVPDALASVTVARKGHADMAVSNAIGSNVFDILLGLGIPWMLGAIVYGKSINVTVAPVGTVVIPISILFVIIVLLIAILAITGWKLSKRLGISLFLLYAAFIAYSLSMSLR